MIEMGSHDTTASHTVLGYDRVRVRVRVRVRGRFVYKPARY